MLSPLEEKNFAQSPLGKLTGAISINSGTRPCIMAGYRGTVLQKFLFDAEIFFETLAPDEQPGSTRSRIMERRRQSGLYT